MGLTSCTAYYERATTSRIHSSRYCQKGEVIIEVDSIGSEFYIMLDGRAQYLSKGNPTADYTKEVIEKTKNYKVVSPHTGQRQRSNFSGKLG